jgi:glycosyltransferase involved in cell wall biosynthesis
MNTNPLISVIMASYNHEAFVAKTIESVLAQTYNNLELIITDDGSADRTVEVIRKFTDPRIKLFVFEKNQGACAATNHCIQNTQGEYIAVINSDDFWHEDKLRLQLDTFNKHPDLGAVFSSAQFVDEQNAPMTRGLPADAEIFSQKNRTRGEWLRRFFYDGNCLCHPSILIKAECYKVLGLYDNRFRQLPDFDMWIKLLKKYDIQILENKLLYFRQLRGGKNTSAPSSATNIRTINELYLIAYNFFDNISVADFKNGFSDLITNKDFTTDEEFEIEKTFIYLKATAHEDLTKIYQAIGLKKLFELLGNPITAKILSDKYGYAERTFHDLSPTLTCFRAPLFTGSINLSNKLKRYILRRFSKYLNVFLPQKA